MVEAVMDTSNGEAATFTSIGKLGVSRRSHERLYVNGTHFSSDPAEFDRNFQRLVEIGKRNENRVGRSVFRGLVSGSVLNHILNSDLSGNLEVALPVGELTGDSSCLVYMAHNKPERTEAFSREYMVRKTINSQEEEVAPPLNKIELAVGQGYVFTSKIAEEQVDQIHSLWGDTFGWKRQEVDSLRRRLEMNMHRNPSERDVWLSAASKNGEIIGVAMAEKLSVPAKNGNLDLVESTEWRVKDGYGGNGVMTATLGMLNAQILSDLKDDPNGTPVIFAECNFQVRADLTGRKAGFHIPDRIVNGHPVSQILTQNVLVRDGSKLGDGKLRDFTFMYLPRKAMQQHYNAAQVKEMRSLIVA